jgi:hypothetical protein
MSLPVGLPVALSHGLGNARWNQEKAMNSRMTITPKWSAK